MRTLHEILEDRGPTLAGRELGYSRTYIWMVLTGRRSVSAELLERALSVYGNEVDLVGTLARSRASRSAAKAGA